MEDVEMAKKLWVDVFCRTLDGLVRGDIGPTRVKLKTTGDFCALAAEMASSAVDSYDEYWCQSEEGKQNAG